VKELGLIQIKKRNRLRGTSWYSGGLQCI